MAATISVAFGTLFIFEFYAQFLNEILRRNIGWILGLFLSGLLIMGIKRLIPYVNMLEDFAQKIKTENKNIDTL